mgnify:CR=1 FL=1
MYLVERCTKHFVQREGKEVFRRTKRVLLLYRVVGESKEFIQLVYKD